MSCRHVFYWWQLELVEVERKMLKGDVGSGKINTRPSVAGAFKELGAYGLLDEFYGGEIPEQRIRRLVSEGKMPAEAVAVAKSFWKSRLRKPIVDPRGVEIVVTIDDLYHLIVDPRSGAIRNVLKRYWILP